MKKCLILPFIFGAFVANAQLNVELLPLKVTGQKAVLPLLLRNDCSDAIRSARAAVFLLDQEGTMVAHGVQWVIGSDRERLGLAAGATNVFNFVVTGHALFKSVDLTAKVSFSRVLFNDGKIADPEKDVVINVKRK